MAETPNQIQLDVTFGPSLRAVVVSALVHVRNKMDHSEEALTEYSAAAIVTEEISKWTPVHPEDTLPQWLFHRYQGDGVGPASKEWANKWTDLPPEDKAYWEHEAAAVRRAVGRGGFKERAYEDIPPMEYGYAPSVNNPRRNDDGSFTIYDSREPMSPSLPNHDGDV